MIGPLVLASLVALRRRAPRAHRMASTLRTPFTTAMRVVNRVHRDTADGRANTLPARATGLAQVLVCVVGIRHCAHGREAVRHHAARLSGRKAKQRKALVLADELHIRTS